MDTDNDDEILDLLTEALHSAEVLDDGEGPYCETRAGTALGWVVSVPAPDYFDPHAALADFAHVLADRLRDYVIDQLTRAQRRELLWCANVAAKAQLLHSEPTTWEIRKGIHRRVRDALQHWRCLWPNGIDVTPFGRAIGRELAAMENRKAA